MTKEETSYLVPNLAKGRPVIRSEVDSIDPKKEHILTTLVGMRLVLNVVRSPRASMVEYAGIDSLVDIYGEWRHAT